MPYDTVPYGMIVLCYVDQRLFFFSDGKNKLLLHIIDTIAVTMHTHMMSRSKYPVSRSSKNSKKDTLLCVSPNTTFCYVRRDTELLIRSGG